MTLALAAAVLTATGVWLILRGGAVRIIIGFILLGHAATLVIISAGGTDRREAPLADGQLDPAAAADPLPQAFVLTAIVITFGLTVFLLWLVSQLHDAGGDAERGAP